MNEYEKYRLQWMLDHDYSLPDLLERLSDIAMNENLDEAMEEYYYNISKGDIEL